MRWPELRVYRGILIVLVVLAFLLIPLGSTSQTASEPGRIEVATYLRTQLPPVEGAPVCLTGGVDVIGRVKSVHLLPAHAEYHDAWEVIMEINGRDASGITTDSVVYARSPEYPEAARNCGGAPGHALFLDINVIDAGQPIANHAVLRGEVTYLAEIAYMVPPKPWWRKVINWALYVIAIGLAAILIFLLRRRVVLRKSSHTVL
jgi:hypothetical protein